MRGDKTILLTGATGFLGSNLLPRLLREGFDVVVLKRSFSNVARIVDLLPQVSAFDIDRIPLQRVFEERRVHVIVHCATNYGRRAVQPTVITEANLTLPLHLLQLAAPHGVRGFVNSDTILDKRINNYSLSKSHFVDWMRLLSHEMTCVNAALEHFYGPHDDRTKFATYIVTSLLDAVTRIELTPGQQRRDFVHVDDVVDAFLCIIRFALEAPRGFHRFDIGTGTSIPIREFVETAREVVGNTTTVLDFGALPYREGEVMESTADIAPLRARGWKPRVALRDGLARMVEAERRGLVR